MRQLVIESTGDESVLQWVEVEEAKPGANEVVVDLAYTALNPMDVAVRAGRVTRPGQTFPLVLGMETGGRISALGEGVSKHWLGCRVVSELRTGGYAEKLVAPVESLQPVDSRLDLKTAVAWRACGRTAWHLLHTAHHVHPGQLVLVHSAAGAVGLMAMQLARIAGARVLGLAGGPDKVKRAAGFSGCDVIDYLDDGWSDRVKEWTGGDGVDLILDGVQGPQAGRNFDLLAPMGKVIYFGSMAGSPAPAVEPRQLFLKSHQVAGFMLAHVSSKRMQAADGELLDLIASGQLKVPISEVVPLSQVAEYHRRLANRQTWGRVLFEVGGED